MNTLDELVYYCNEANPVGALMLTGEWGCGKTYLIEHELKEKLSETHIIVRVSLFGVDSIDSLNQLVGRQWIAECMPTFGKMQEKESTVNVGKSALSAMVSMIPYLNMFKDSILAINPMDYVFIETKVGKKGKEKKVILVFDDLERCKLDTVAVLGCINEYCENQGFNTIIVANEDKIGDAHTNEEQIISYDLVKEKIVNRTIRYAPNYNVIVNSILEGQFCGDDEYSEFLRECALYIKSFFLEELEEPLDEDVKRPRNIRSLKCALQNFYRIYKPLKDAQINPLEIYFYSFMAYTLAEKAGMVKEDEEDELFSGGGLQKMYPLYRKDKMLHAARKWIHRGEWDQDLFQYELENLIRQQKTKEPKDIIKCMRFIDCEDEDVLAGYPGLLGDAYSGKLTLDEYVVLVTNSYFIRAYDIAVPTPIDWSKVTKGVEISFQKLIGEKDFVFDLHHTISEESQKLLIAEELGVYNMIKGLESSNRLMFEKNKRLYIDKLKEEGIDAFVTCENKRFDIFDKEMAMATADCFYQCQQYGKSSFPWLFSRIWDFCDTMPSVRKPETREGFKILVSELAKFRMKYKDEGKNIAAKHTEVFIKYVNELIEKLDNAIADETENNG